MLPVLQLKWRRPLCQWVVSSGFRGQLLFRSPKGPRLQVSSKVHLLQPLGWDWGTCFQVLATVVLTGHFAVAFKYGPRPRHRHHLTCWIRNSVAGVGSGNLYFTSPPDSCEPHSSLWTTGPEKGVRVAGAWWWGVSSGKWITSGSSWEPLVVPISQRHSQRQRLFYLVAFDISSGENASSPTPPFTSSQSLLLKIITTIFQGYLVYPSTHNVFSDSLRSMQSVSSLNPQSCHFSRSSYLALCP